MLLDNNKPYKKYGLSGILRRGYATALAQRLDDFGLELPSLQRAPIRHPRLVDSPLCLQRQTQQPAHADKPGLPTRWAVPATAKPPSGRDRQGVGLPTLQQ
jgi:hypothetical protein